MDGNQSNSVVVMTGELGKFSILNLEVPGSNFIEDTFFLLSFALVILFLYTIKQKGIGNHCRWKVTYSFSCC